jgi:hypothetical protein
MYVHDLELTYPRLDHRASTHLADLPTMEEVGKGRSLGLMHGCECLWLFLSNLAHLDQVPPAAIMASSMPIRKLIRILLALRMKAENLAAGESEAGYVGAFTGHPLDVVKCETNDLLVPASSEIVFEGTISTSNTALEVRVLHTSELLPDGV